MRVHSTLTLKPHFPFTDLWGEDAATAMRKAVHLRYQLIPTLNAAFHHMRTHSVPWIERAAEMVGGEERLLVRMYASQSQSTQFSAWLVEDDGVSDAPARITRFTFDEQTRKFTHVVSGNEVAPRWYRAADILLIERDGRQTQASVDLMMGSVKGEDNSIVILSRSFQ
jgi:hypothetical protein